MAEINERISACVKATNLTKTAFAERINVTQQYVSNLCLGKKSPSDRTIADICREFNVNEHWLRTGEGDMFTEVTRSDEIAAFMGDILSGEPDFRARFIAVLARLDATEWAILEKMADYLVEEMQKEKADPKQAGLNDETIL